MHALAVAFLIGIGLISSLSDLPDGRWAWWLAVCVPCLWFFPRWRLPLALVCGFLWALLWGANGVSNILAPSLEGKHLTIEGHVAGLPATRENGVRFEFDVRHLESSHEIDSLPKRIRLTWRDAPAQLAPGQRIRLEVVLKRPHGFMNPGGFDYEQWLFQHGIGATGYVVNALGDVADESWRYPIEYLRYVVRQAVFAQHNNAWTGALVGLAMGDQSAITNAQWDILALTGTTHLIAISGMHITLLAAIALFLTRWVWSRAGRAPLRWPAPKAAAVVALGVAVLYSAFAGFSIPTQRSLVMVAVVTWGIVFDRYYSSASILAIALIAVLVWDPFAILTPGFWLSFGAVALLVFGMQNRVAVRGIYWQWGRAQWLVAIGMLPLTLLLFQRVAPLSPLANFLAVPWLSLVVTPLAMIGTFLSALLPDIATFFLNAASWCLEIFWPYLTWIAGFSISSWIPNVPPAWAVVPAIIGVLWWLAPRGIPGRWVGLFWCIPLFYVQTRPLDPGELELTLLDVGQGLAVVARTAHHVMVYDTGPKLGGDFDTGGAVVVPFLRQRNIDRVDTLVISHGDNDHAGGTTSVAKVFAPSIIYSSVPEQLLPLTAQPCFQTTSWTWDGITFKVIHPPREYGVKSENNRSCVVFIESPGGRFLLAGDIERSAERYLVSQFGEMLRADWLVAPHHGSAGASSQEFVDTVHPHFVLFATGYRNRYGFPKTEVLERYRAVGANAFDTATDGALIATSRPDSGLTTPERYRATARRFWHTIEG